MKTLEEMEVELGLMTTAREMAEAKVLPEVELKYRSHQKNRQGTMLVHSPLAFSIREVNTNAEYWLGEKRDV